MLIFIENLQSAKNLKIFFHLKIAQYINYIFLCYLDCFQII